MWEHSNSWCKNKYSLCNHGGNFRLNFLQIILHVYLYPWYMHTLGNRFKVFTSLIKLCWGYSKFVRYSWQDIMVDQVTMKVSKIYHQHAKWQQEHSHFCEYYLPYVIKREHKLTTQNWEFIIDEISFSILHLIYKENGCVY